MAQPAQPHFSLCKSTEACVQFTVVRDFTFGRSVTLHMGINHSKSSLKFVSWQLYKALTDSFISFKYFELFERIVAFLCILYYNPQEELLLYFTFNIEKGIF